MTCANLSAGTISCWGDNHRGQVGNNSTTNADPVDVGLTNVNTVAVGGLHACTIDSSARAWCWGSNSAGQLGDGTTTTRHVPTRAPLFDGAVAFSLGRSHTCASKDGALRCIGSYAFGPLGDPQGVGPTATALSCPE
jgi:alpha-tubulin suppressor-like RCC1 family protein